MKIFALEDLIRRHFTPAEGLPSAADASMANVVLYQLLQAPLFENTYANHRLYQQAEGFFQIGVPDSRHSCPMMVDIFEDLYPYDFWEPDEDDDAPPPFIDLPVFTIRSATPWEGPLPTDLEREAAGHIQALRRLSPDIALLFAPCAQDLVRRKEVVIEELQFSQLFDRQKQILGTRADARLLRSGLTYHDTRDLGYRSDSLWRFWLAHNGDEVAGVLGAQRNPDSSELVLSYVTVGPGFRGQGLAKRLMTCAMDFAQAHELLFVRTAPGVFSRENPGVAEGFDRWVMAHGVPHVSGSGYFPEAVRRARAELPWEAFCSATKPHCDAWLQACPSLDTKQLRWDNPAEVASLEALKASVAKAKALSPTKQAPVAVSPARPRMG